MTPTLNEEPTYDRALHAYYNSTQGVLTGRPDDVDLQHVMKLMDKHRITYLFNSDASRPRPMFSADGWDSVGVVEIEARIAELSTAQG